jgi:beta-glucoside operon transcriptional antiterminator
MPEDEAASIALHILNAEYDMPFSEGFKATQLLSWINDTIVKHTGREMHLHGHYGERFITHLKYLIQRIIRNEPTREDDDIYSILKEQCPAEINFSEMVAAEIYETYGYKLSKHEIVCMAIHIKRVKG